MTIARIDGVIVSTICHPSMEGHRMVICQPVDETGAEEGLPVLALDPLSAGMHEMVMVSTDGSATREHVKDPNSPLRNMIIAIIDPAPPRGRGATQGRPAA